MTTAHADAEGNSVATPGRERRSERLIRPEVAARHLRAGEDFAEGLLKTAGLAKSLLRGLATLPTKVSPQGRLVSPD